MDHRFPENGERDLLARTVAPSPLRRRRRRDFPKLLLVLCLCGMAVAVVYAYRWHRLGGDPAAFRMATSTLSALVENDLAQLTRTCDDPSGVAPTSQTLAQREAALEYLARFRTFAEKQGVNWDEIRPAGFGGIRVRADESQAALIGNIYFRSGDVMFALEVTGRRCGDDFLVAELWQCKPLALGSADLRKHSLRRYAAFLEQGKDDETYPDINAPRHIFFLFD